MARTVSATGPKYLTRSSAISGTLPLSFAAWGRYGSTPGGFGGLVAISVSAGAPYWALCINTSGGATAIYNDGGGTAQADSGTGSTNTWQHYGATFASGAKRAIFNGTIVTTGVSINLSVNTTSIGALGTGAAFTWDGDIAEAAIWSVDLGQGDWTALAAGVSPLFVRPDALLAYWPLLGAYSPEIDVWRRNELTLTNTPATAAHCRILSPSMAQIGRIGGTAASTGQGRMFAVF